MAELIDGINDEDIANSKDIHIEMLDYEYVEKSSNIKELKTILAVLKSGKQGHYPHVSIANSDFIFMQFYDQNFVFSCVVNVVD
jgi:hypothetical protein